MFKISNQSCRGGPCGHPFLGNNTLSKWVATRATPTELTDYVINSMKMGHK
jgi:hypothetical protein